MTVLLTFYRLFLFDRHGVKFLYGAAKSAARPLIGSVR